MSLSGVAKSTLEIIERRSYVAPSGEPRDLRAAIDSAIDNTRLYRPDELATLARPRTGSPTLTVTDETTATAARRLAATGRVAALNFASAKNPGGGFLGGAKAQEEDLARCSALYTCQLTARDYYDANRACESMLYTDHIIYSPAVPFFRDERLDLLEQPFLCSIFTAPAPNAGEALRRDRDARPAITQVLQHRAAMILAVAAAHDERRLVLGAWGCGVFRNDPAEVASVFRALVVDADFDEIVFAIRDRRPDQPVLTAFQRAFAT